MGDVRGADGVKQEETLYLAPLDYARLKNHPLPEPLKNQYTKSCTLHAYENKKF